MKLFCLSFFFLAFNLPVLSQNKFEIKNLSKSIDIKILVADCDALTCSGKASFSFYKKGNKKPFQVIKVAN